MPNTPIDNHINTMRSIRGRAEEFSSPRVALRAYGRARSAADPSGAAALARALGIASAAAFQTASDEEQRAKSVGLYEAEKVAAEATPEDLRKKNAARLLSDYGAFDSTQNPYAVPLIDKYKGQKAAEDANAEFSAHLAQLPYDQQPKTAEEYTQQFADFMSPKMAETRDNANVMDADAFNAGWSRNYNAFLQAKAQEGYKIQAQNYDLARKEGYQSVMTTLAGTAGKMTPDQLYSVLQSQIKEIETTASPAEVAEVLKQGIAGIIREKPQPGLVDALLTNLKTRGYNGQEISVGELLGTDVGDALKEYEYQYYSQGYRSSVYQKQNDWFGMSADEIWDDYQKLAGSNPTLYRMMAQDAETMIRQRRKEENAIMLSQIKADITSNNQSIAKNAAACMARTMMLKGAQGYQSWDGVPTTASWDEIIDRAGYYWDGDGKAHKATLEPSERRAILSDVANTLLNDTNVPETTRVANYLQFLNSSKAETLKTSVNQSYNAAFAQLGSQLGNPNQDAVNPNVMSNVTQAMYLYHQSPEMFGLVFDKNVTESSALLLDLADLYGSEQDAIRQFAAVKERIKQPEFEESFEDLYKSARVSEKLQDIGDQFGIRDLNSSLLVNTEVMDGIKSMARLQWATGAYPSMDDCVERSLTYFDSNYLVINGIGLPKAINHIEDIGGGMTQEAQENLQYRTGRQFLQSKLRDISEEINEQYRAAHPGALGLIPSVWYKINPTEISVQYDKNNKRLTFSYSDTQHPPYQQTLTLDEYRAELLDYYRANNQIKEDTGFGAISRTLGRDTDSTREDIDVLADQLAAGEHLR